MISWLLALVLLSAADAITTPAGAASSQVEPTASPTSPAAARDPPINPTVNQKIYTNQFVIEVQGGEEEARRLAQKHGFIYLNHILADYYHLEHRRLARRSVDGLDMSRLDTAIEEEPQVLKLERQVLKKRVKRDFIDLGNQPAVSGALANGASRAQQSPQQSGGQRPVQTLRPNGVGRPTQFMRPANQPPGSLGSYQPITSSPDPLTSAHLHPDGRRIGGAHSLVFSGSGTSRLTPAQQQYLDQLEMTSSGPPPFFLHANLSLAQQNINNINKQHRPPPPPIQLNELRQQGANQSSAARHQHANETIRPAPFNDPSWPLMWYLDGGARNGFDLNVQAAWKMGYTGKGIVITILDDGLEKDHPDLQANYDPLASFDINGDDADPMPRYDANDSNRHGTRCAGEVAAVPDNNICSIGIAYNSKVGGVRMLDGDVTDAVEARSLGLNNQHIHIYSASWGPDDNGKTVDGPGELATRAFIEGVTNGRQGLGSIFVFASGNGGREHDNCNCDGYTNSIWTLSISSATENGFVPWYIEACSSTLATTYSSGSYDERQIATTDIRHSCTSNHTGTSASAPIAAGICALVLESNPRLTWRDMQHIVVRTAKPANLVAKDWRANAMGRNVSHAFGYGLMDAAAMINVAKKWTTVPMQYTCQVSSPQMEKFIPAKGHIELKLLAKCDNVRYLEHVQSKVTLTATRRGDMHIYLTSPSGTRSTLLAQRPNDQTEQGFRNWPFMTVHNWGESPNGVWTLEVHNDGKPANRAFFKEWTLMLYGTNDDPNKHLDMNSVRAASSNPVASSHNPVTSSPYSQQSTANRAPSMPTRLQSSMNLDGPGGSMQSPPPPSFVPGKPDPPINKNHLNQHLMRPQTATPNQNNQVAVQSLSSPPPPINNDGNSMVVNSVTPATRPSSITTPSGSSQTVAASVQYENDGHGIEDSSRPAEPIKKDFEIVSAPTGSNRAQSPVNGGNSTEAPSSSTSTEKSGVALDDGGRLDSSASQPTTKPPVGVIEDSKGQHDNLDANHLDLKLTKDYRSSGEQDKMLQQDRDRPSVQPDSNGDIMTFQDTSKQRDNAATSHHASPLLLHSSIMAVFAILSMVAQGAQLEIR